MSHDFYIYRVQPTTSGRDPITETTPNNRQSKQSTSTTSFSMNIANCLSDQFRSALSTDYAQQKSFQTRLLVNNSANFLKQTSPVSPPSSAVAAVAIAAAAASGRAPSIIGIETRSIICLFAVATKYLLIWTAQLIHLLGLPTFVGACSTRTRYDEQHQTAFQRFEELDDCYEAYQGYCRNGGMCKMTTDIAQRIVPVCSCQPGFRGRQCEHISDPNIYFSRQQGQMEMAAMSGLIIAIVFIIVFASVVLCLYRRYLKNVIRIGEASFLSTRATTEYSARSRRNFQSVHVMNSFEQNYELDERKIVHSNYAINTANCLSCSLPSIEEEDAMRTNNRNNFMRPISGDCRLSNCKTIQANIESYAIVSSEL